jgi:hypothetical protein
VIDTNAGVVVKKKVASKSMPIKSVDKYKSIKTAIWAYFFLLIFEGALRKWILPFLADPLLLIRDPIVIWAVFKAYQQETVPRNGYVITSIVVGVISIFTALLFGHGNILVAIYGARPFLFYLPFIFIIAKVFNYEDVIKMGKITLWITLPITLLVALQFYSPQSAWVNRGVGGDESGAGFNGALGFFRPPGTFSFTNGTTLFYTFVSCYVFYFWLNPDKVNRLLLIAATFSLIASIPLSISRTLLFSVAVVALFVIIATARKPKYFTRVLGASIGLFLFLLILSQVSFFQTATEAFSHRFNVASEQEGGLEGTLVDRYLGGLIAPFISSSNAPFFGSGSGIHTSVGTKLLSGSVISGISEGEIGRVIGEIGIIMGFIIIVVRVGISLRTIKASYEKLILGDTLPWILLSNSLLLGVQANWAQQTSLGFSILSIGIVLASVNKVKRLGIVKKGLL